MAERDDAEAISALRIGLKGPVLTSDDPGWAQEIGGFNLAARHTPELIVGAAQAEDVAAAVRFAAQRGMPIAVQATGHGFCATVDAGVLVTTRRMDRIAIDPRGRTATLGAGVTWESVISAAAPHGLAPLNGSSPLVGVVGFTVGGGMPVMGRTFGFAADHVVAFDVVTADGVLHHADGESEPDLFWGLRGGKGNLGIVTEMTVELMEVPTLFGGGLMYAEPHIPAVLVAFSKWCEDLPETLTPSLAVLRFPPLPMIPEPLRGKTVAHLRFCYVGDSAEGERLLSPMRSAAPAFLDNVRTMPYSEIASVYQDPVEPIPFRDCGALLREFGEDAVDAMLGEVGPGVRSPLLLVEVRLLGGAMSRSPELANSVGSRDAGFSLNAVAVLAPEIAHLAEPAEVALLAAMAPWTTGRTLVNFHGPAGDEADRARAWDRPVYERLLSLVGQYDPQGMFRFGHAIGR